MTKNCALEGIYKNIHQDLIDACRAGNRQAQFKVYKLYFKAMFNTSLRIVNDATEAEDILQESFLDAFRRLDSYSGEGSFGMWLKRIVVNNSLDVLRKRKELLPLDEAGEDFPDKGDGYDEETVQYQVREVKDAIARLQEDYRVIVTLFLIEGYDHEEISGILGITNQLSRTRYSRARQKLQEIIRENRLKNAFIYN